MGVEETGEWVTGGGGPAGEPDWLYNNPRGFRVFQSRKYDFAPPDGVERVEP